MSITTYLISVPRRTSNIETHTQDSTRNKKQQRNDGLELANFVAWLGYEAVFCAGLNSDVSQEQVLIYIVSIPLDMLKC